MTYNLSDGVAIITGGGSGIGKAVAKRLGAEGCKVALWDVNTEGLQSVAAELRGKGVTVTTQRVDVSDLDVVRSALERTIAELGAPPTILVNSAGIRGEVASILESTPEGFETTMRINVRGSYNTCLAIAPLLVERKRGTIVNIASWAGKRARTDSLAYSSSKFAVIGITQSMALDLAKHGVRVNAVCPGIIDGTAMRKQSDSGYSAKSLPDASDRVKQIPLGRMGVPEEVANAVAYLVSDESAYMTGQAINVTGGLWLS